MARGKPTASKPTPKPPAPKIGNPVSAKGKSRANDPKKAQLPAISKGKDVEKPSRSSNTIRAATTSAAPSSSKRATPEELFEEDDEIVVPPPSKKKKKAIIPATPEPEQDEDIECASSPLSSPPPELLTKRTHHAASSPPPTKSSSSARQAIPDAEHEVGEDEDEEDEEDVKPTIDDINEQDQDEDDDIDEQEQDEDDEEVVQEQGNEDEDAWAQFQNPKAAADALIASLDRDSNIKKSDRTRYLRPFQKAARLVPRLITPFLSIGPTIETAMRLDPTKPYEQQTDQEALESLNEETYRDVIGFYNRLLDHCPQLAKAMHAFADNAGAFGDLLKYASSFLWSSCYTDCALL
ncbi:hypothetical protein QCA50_015551 [Cerrena zonata]|uniref:Uncharacterized protein n=1 Tax=Cerrena zonata TaxID=2478898 RepID=A0AAW0FT90_9APHY